MFAIPLAWLQLKREKVRLLVALAGISFAVILMFIQLGFQDALFASAIRFHENLKGDIFLISPQSTALISMRSFSQRRLLQAFAMDGVENVSPVYISFSIWKNPFWEGPPTSQTRSILVAGIDPADDVFLLPEIANNRDKIQLENVVLFDADSRAEFGPIPAKFTEFQQKRQQGESCTYQSWVNGRLQEQQAVNCEITTEADRRRVKVGGLFRLGASFGADGNIVTSDLNFLRIFDGRQKGLIDIGIVQLKPGTSVDQVLERIKQTFPGDVQTDPKKTAQEAKQDFVVGDVRVLSRQAFIDLEKNYWRDSTAIGFIFTLGTALGFIVGIVIVYQILYTDVSDHLAEYATLKAMGYKNTYLLSVVFQEALILSVMGYIPGYILCIGLYNLTKTATSLPIAMTLERAILVLCLSVVMCMVSGAVAVRKVQSADPADIF